MTYCNERVVINYPARIAHPNENPNEPVPPGFGNLSPPISGRNRTPSHRGQTRHFPEAVWDSPAQLEASPPGIMDASKGLRRKVGASAAPMPLRRHRGHAPTCGRWAPGKGRERELAC
jgi:hypothetical protein